MTKARYIIVEQFGGWWRLSPSQWNALVQRCADGGEYNLDDDGTRLSRRPAVIWRFESSGDLTSSSNDVWLRRPLDWSEEDWQSELADIHA